LPCPRAIAFLSEESVPVFVGVGSKHKYGFTHTAGSATLYHASEKSASQAYLTSG
jgi:hypothetical protein